MPDLTARGVVVQGHGVASGRSPGSPFAAGTIALQAPHLRGRGLDLDGFHPATINVDLAPAVLRVTAPRWRFKDVAWTEVHPPETFSFVECRIGHAGREVDALIYHPHPETKPMHHQPSTVVEVLAPFIDGLGYGDEVTLALAPGQAELRRPTPPLPGRW